MLNGLLGGRGTLDAGGNTVLLGLADIELSAMFPLRNQADDKASSRRIVLVPRLRRPQERFLGNGKDSEMTELRRLVVDLENILEESGRGIPGIGWFRYSDVPALRASVGLVGFSPEHGTPQQVVAGLKRQLKEQKGVPNASA